MYYSIKGCLWLLELGMLVKRGHNGLSSSVPQQSSANKSIPSGLEVLQSIFHYHTCFSIICARDSSAFWALGVSARVLIQTQAACVRCRPYEGLVKMTCQSQSHRLYKYFCKNAKSCQVCSYHGYCSCKCWLV